MAASLVVEDGTGLANANVLNSLQDAQDYFEGSVGGFNWDTSAQDEAARSLVTGQRKMKRGIDWNFPKLNSDQALPYPFLINGVAVIPVVIKEAELEFALWIRQQTANGESTAIEEQKVKTLAVPGEISVSFENEAATSLEIPAFILQMVREYGQPPSQPKSRNKVKVLRVGYGY